MSNEAAERLREHLIRGIGRPLIHEPLLDEALTAERRAYGKRVLANFTDRVDRAWGNENAAKAVDLLRWALDEEAAR